VVVPSPMCRSTPTQNCGGEVLDGGTRILCQVWVIFLHCMK